MNPIPIVGSPRTFPTYVYYAPNPLPTDVDWPPRPRRTPIGPDGVMRGGNALPGISPPGT